MSWSANKRRRPKLTDSYADINGAQINDEAKITSLRQIFSLEPQQLFAVDMIFGVAWFIGLTNVSSTILLTMVQIIEGGVAVCLFNRCNLS